MVAIPVWLQGRHLTNFYAIGMTYDASGNLTPGPTATLTGKTRRVSIRSSPAKENISPVTSPKAHNMITEENSSVEIDVLLTRLGVNPLAYLVANYDVVYVQWTRGPQHWEYYGSRGSFDEEIGSKGGNPSRLVLDQVDIGVSDGAGGLVIPSGVNPYYATP